MRLFLLVLRNEQRQFRLTCDVQISPICFSCSECFDQRAESLKRLRKQRVFHRYFAQSEHDLVLFSVISVPYNPQKFPAATKQRATCSATVTMIQQIMCYARNCQIKTCVLLGCLKEIDDREKEFGRSIVTRLRAAKARKIQHKYKGRLFSIVE